MHDINSWFTCANPCRVTSIPAPLPVCLSMSKPICKARSDRAFETAGFSKQEGRIMISAPIKLNSYVCDPMLTVLR